ncbi:metal-dependent hydrolase [Simiduia sp. 21SJ11W-1]|uniref:metal-dependent hydrolase n=1 Tax=Simiduia sp. 21SJ11W-1 TaxID=2909669 RepID=UPI00209DEB31|nr:metal-dependent hydrolase [Simiduia sp. 21SJ11W-1]UTA46714.1 metal-dependent hydrolase [Simiduia sp. 21SJ11W-1]
MLIGHYSAALAAKAVKPQLPLWQLFIAAQLVDIVWVLLCAFNIERFTINPSLNSNPLELIFQPFTHSLLASGLWSLAAALLVVGLYRLYRPAAWLLGAVVASHWLLDFFVHRPDLPIWPGVKVGLALWDYSLVAMSLEMALIALAGGYLWRNQTHGKGWYAGLTVVLLALVAVNYVLPPPLDKTGILLGAMAVYLIAPVVAWWLERRVRKPCIHAMENSYAQQS